MADINKIIGIGIDDNASSGLNKIDNGLTKVTQSTKTLTKETTSTTKAIAENGGAMGLLNELTGGLAMTFKDAGEATALFGGKLKGLRGAIIASGIGALVIVIGELVSNWDKWSKVINGSADEIENLKNQLAELNLQRERYLQSSNTEIQLLEINGASSRRILQEKYKQNHDLIKQQEDALKKTESLYRKELNNDRDSEETLAALNARNEAQGKLNDLKNNALILEAQFNKLEKDTAAEKKKNLDSQENEKQARLDKLAKLIESYRIKTEDFDDKTDLAKIDRAEKRAIAELNLLKGTEEQKKVIREYYDRLRMEAIDKEYEANKEKQKKAGEYLFDGLKKELDEQLAKSRALRDIKAMQNEAMLVKDIEYWEDAKSIASAAESFMSALQDDQLIRGQGLRDALLLTEKGFAVANVWLSEAQASATAKFNASMVPLTVQAGPYTIPNPMKPVAMAGAARAVITNKINAGIATAAILAQTIAGLNKRGSGGGGGASEGGIGGGGNPQAQFNIVGSSATNQLASTIGAQQNQPVNAYVVGSDVATQNALDRNRVNTATFL